MLYYTQGGDFAFNFVALWIRLITLIILAIVVTAIALFFGRKKFKKWEKIACVCLAVVFVLLGGAYTLKSLIAPEIKTIVGIYKSERSVKGASPFQMEYCFDCKNETIYLDLDLISKNIIFEDHFIRGREYTISYETQSNLIVSVTQNK